jgi:hypothetical protein
MMKHAEYGELQKVFPVATQRDGIGKVEVFRDDGKVKPTAAVESANADIGVIPWSRD